MLSPLSRAAAGRTASLIHPAVSAFPERVIGSACALSFSRLARRSLTLRPAHSRCHQFVTRYPKASANSLPPWLLRLLPAGAFAGWALHPLESAAFSRRTPEADIGHTELPRCSIQSGVLARLRQRTVSASSVRYRRRDKSRSGRTFWRYVDNSPWTRSLRGPR